MCIRDRKYERRAVTARGGPKDFAVDGHLAHQVVGLFKVAREPSSGRDNGELVFRFVAIQPGFLESPFGVVQKQAGEGEEPKENEEEQAGVKMEIAIPAFANSNEAGAISRSFGTRRLVGRRRLVFSGRRHK